MYNINTQYNRIPPPPPTLAQMQQHPQSRRNPLASNPINVNHANVPHHAVGSHPAHGGHPAKQVAHGTPPPKPAAKAPNAGGGGSPPLPRQNTKAAPPDPPKIIVDKAGRAQFSRIAFLGEGGFARVYEVKDARGMRLACKVVTKDSLKTKKAKTKLYAEIKIHRSLEHPNIVSFKDCFEDDANVYMTLELCASGSLMDMLRRRRRFTEPETRFFMVQLIGACHYMHAYQVIHRDLKLGNLFLDASMNVKVGDFGLAALIENPGERKKTICGTPNYIAPEVLFDTANGHSFEVDTWSIGVILYTLVVGRPPFQTKDVKAIYKRIRDNEYEFPTDRPISPAVQNLIQQILTPLPSSRPTLHTIVSHQFFVQGPVPSYIPTSAHDGPPDFRGITRAQSDANLARLRRASLLDVDFSSLVPSGRDERYERGVDGEFDLGEDEVRPSAGTTANRDAARADRENHPAAANTRDPAPASRHTRQRSATNAPTATTTTTIAQQEKEFQKAVQPGSPISALLSSARRPLVIAGMAGANGGMGENGGQGNLLRKLQSVKESPLGRRTVVRGVDGVYEERERDMRRAPGGAAAEEDEVEEVEEVETRLRKKELEAQKARIVAQMVPVREDEEDEEMGDPAYGGEMDVDVDQPQPRRRARDAGTVYPAASAGAAQAQGRAAGTGMLQTKYAHGQQGDVEERRRREREKQREQERQLERERERERERLDKENVQHQTRNGRAYSSTLAPSASTVPNAHAVQRKTSAAAIRGERDARGQAQGLAPAANILGSSNGVSGGNALAGSFKSNLNIAATAADPKTNANAAMPEPKLSGFEAAARTLSLFFDAKANGRVYRDPEFGARGLEPPDEKVFIVSWVDYCNKYGMGYALTDGSVGVHFNDSSTLVLSPDKVHFDYITSRRSGTVYLRKSYTVSVFPEDLKSKVYLLKQFEQYIMSRLYGEYEYTWEDRRREKGMEWVQKYLRMKHVIVFKLSHDVLQFNFMDHSKVILSSHGLLVTYIDKHYKMSRWSLADLVADSLLYSSSPAEEGGQYDPEAVKFNQKLMDKLKYCKEVLVSIKTASANGAGAGAGAVAE